MPVPDVDVAILGGGCAGLSLAMRLAGTKLRVAVVEPRHAYSDDRTWSFWQTAPHPFDDCTRRRWDRWSVEAGGRTVQRISSSLRYQSLSALAVYQKAIRTLGTAANVQLLLGTSVVGDPRRTALGTALEIETTAGALSAAWVVDSRPRPADRGFGQYFIGHEIEVDGAVFDEREVELMAFATPRRERTDFIYTLPFARDRALIEATSFAAADPGEAVLGAALTAAIEARSGGRRVTCHRVERGFIPMRCTGGQPAAATPEPRWLRAGLAGGAARPSTGYAFQRIQATADVQAAALVHGRPLAPVALDSRFTCWMDGLFLRVLRRWPERAPGLFLELFAQAPPDRLERFLSGSTAPRDRLAVVGSLPPMPFLRELLAV